MKYTNLCLPSRTNSSWDKCGFDNPEKCKDINHYNNFYTQDISYSYNSRGYRDEEWPDDLSECIFVVGASYTQGTGLPLHDTWGKQLERLTGRRVIMISLYSASNDWLLRNVIYIKEHIKPKYIIAHWSYFHRRENLNSLLSDEERRIEQGGFSKGEDLKHFEETILNTPAGIINVLLSIVENIELVKYLPALSELEIGAEVIDYARDGVHYGLQTSTNLAVQLSKHIS